MAGKYDLVIIGSGSAAMSAAFYCNSNGMKTAVVDSKPLGGTCALRGCDPKKVLYGVTGMTDAVKRLSGKGLKNPRAEVDWKELVEFKKSFTEPMPPGIEKSLNSEGIDTYHSRAHFTGPNKIKTGDGELEAGKILIASGAKPADPGFPGSEYMLDNEQFMELEYLPREIVFVGGGYISVEFAGIAARAGSKVTIMHRGERILKNFDAELVERVTKTLEEQGINILTGTSVTSIEKSANGYTVHGEEKSGEMAVKGDLVVHGLGRSPNIDDMDLEAGNVDWGKGGVAVNRYMQSVSNKSVYAAGDCAGTPGNKLTPVANLEGGAAAYNIVHGNEKKPDYTGIPTVVFSLPPLSMVGLTEAQAASDGRKVRINRGDSSSWYNSRRKGLSNTGYKILIDSKTSEILGAHILADNSEEVINTFSLAIRHGIKADELSTYPFAYPSDTTELRYMLM